MARIIAILLLAGACLGDVFTANSGEDDFHNGRLLYTARNFGTCTANLLRAYYSQQVKMYIEVDISSIPAGATIDSAKLVLHYSPTYGRTGTFVIKSARMLRDVTAGARCNSAAQAGEPSWECYATPTAWTTAGCDGEGTDRTAYLDSVVVSATDDSIVMPLTACAQGEYAAVNRYGCILCPVPTSDLYYYGVHNFEAAAEADRPRLTIYYTVPATGGAKWRGAYIGHNLHLWRIP